MIKTLKRNIEKTEYNLFLEKFKGKKFSVSGQNGKIISIKTDDKEIIAFAKELGLKQDG